VRDFKNASVPPQMPLQQQLEYYGISQDKLRLADLPKDPDERTTQFIHRGFQAELEEGLLGICTQFHEKFCYFHKSISIHGAVDLAILLGLLVDRAKQGYIFSDDNWNCFRRKISRIVPPRPAYRENDESLQTDHIIDRLVFKVARPTVDKVLTEFHARFPEQNTWDSDLVRLWREEKESSKQDKELQQVLDCLEKEIREVRDFWAKYPRDSNFTDRVSRAYSKFNDIMPMDIDHPLARRWREDANRSPASHWRLLRASAIIEKSSKVAWWVAGRELGQLKAMASGGYHTVVTPIHACYKPDGNYVRKANVGRLTGVGVEVESVMGDGESEGEDCGSVFEWPDEARETRESLWW
jgi:RNA dependent RNA polymerase